MKNHSAKHFYLKKIFATTTLSVILFGCVSVNLDSGVTKKAEKIELTEPTLNFVKIKNKTVDQAWQNVKNGNTIAYLSECNSKSDPTLKTLQDENLSALTNIEIIDSKELTFNDREALLTTANGLVDGVGIRIRLLIFKKNGCNYTVSFVGRKKFFLADEMSFSKFIEGFKAP